MSRAPARSFPGDVLRDRGALAVFLIAIVLRLAWAGIDHSRHPDESFYRSGDAIEYTTVAENLLSGRGWWSPDSGGQPYHHGPVFPLYVAVFRALGGSFFAVTLANAFLGALTCWGVVRLGRRLVPGEGAVLAGLALAVYPYCLYYTAKILTETLSTFFGLLLFATFLRFSRSPDWSSAVLAGVVLGAATLNHPETYMAPPFLILWVLAAHPARARALRGMVLLLLFAGLTILPWHAFHAARYGKSILLPPSFGAGGLLTQATLDAKGRIERDPEYFERASRRLGIEGRVLDETHGNAGGVAVAAKRVFRDLVSQPGEYLHFIALKFRAMWGLVPTEGAYSGSWAVIPIGALNLLLYAGFLAGLVIYRRREESVLAFTLVLVYTVPHLIFYAQPRYRLPVMPIVVIMAGVAASMAVQRFSGRVPALGASRVSDQKERVR